MLGVLQGPAVFTQVAGEPLSPAPVSEPLLDSGITVTVPSRVPPSVSPERKLGRRWGLSTQLRQGTGSEVENRKARLGKDSVSLMAFAGFGYIFLSSQYVKTCVLKPRS